MPFSTPERWLRISDDDVIELPLGGGDEIWRWSGRGEVVLLFYERTARAEDAATEARAGVVTAASGARQTSLAEAPSRPAGKDGAHTSSHSAALREDVRASTTDPVDAGQNAQLTGPSSVGSPSPPPFSPSPSPPASPSLKTPPPETDMAAEVGLGRGGVITDDEESTEKTNGKKRKKKGKRK